MNKEQFRALPLSKKIRYIICHRTCDIILGAVLLLLMGTWIYEDYIQEPAFMRIEMINACTESPNGESLDPFLMKNGYQPKENKVEISKALQLHTQETDCQFDPSRLLICNVAEGKTDVYFWNAGSDSVKTEDALKSFALMDLRNVLPAELLLKYEDQLVYTDAVLDGGYPCGIILKDNEWIRQNNYYEDCVVGVAVTAADVDLVREFLLYIL